MGKEKKPFLKYGILAIIAFGLMDLMDLLDLMDLFLHEGECVYGICSSNVTNLLAFLSVIICLVTIIVLTYQRRIFIGHSKGDEVDLCSLCKVCWCSPCHFG